MSNKAVLISIRPKWVSLIADGKKTIEIRKTRPRIDTPFKCYIYQTFPKSGDWNEQDGKVVGEFVCDNIVEYHYAFSFDENRVCMSLKVGAVMTPKELFDYAGKNTVYGWHITDLKMYDKPKNLLEFKRWNRTEINAPCAHTPTLYPPCSECKECNLTRPPQSYCFVEELDE